MHHVRHLRGSAGRVEAAHRRPGDQARRHLQQRRLRTARASTPTDDPRASPGAVHPLVCTHPDTGRRMLYLGRRRNAYLLSLELAQSEALLDELWSFVDRPESAWEHAWRVGDLVLWDNRCTMHRRDAFDPASRRIMHRAQVKGEQRPA
ncbi:MAG TPA: TauD/TfdA family dioxygenase [Xanthobacteraceae bacterium]